MNIEFTEELMQIVPQYMKLCSKTTLLENKSFNYINIVFFFYQGRVGQSLLEALEYIKHLEDTFGSHSTQMSLVIK